MITRIETKRMVVFSDLHIGNPFSSVRRKTVEFIQWAADNGYDICINGDGFDVAQVSFKAFSQDVPEVLHALKCASTNGVKVYYVVGNHDIVFENFLFAWGGLKLAPFLNVHCEKGRFRVEHGHLYDPFFVATPRLYDFCTWLGGFVLAVNPSFYKLWIRFEKLKSRILRMRNPRSEGIVGEPESFFSSAKKIEARGFDGIIFGHTHHSGRARLPYGGEYLNPGSWMLNSTFVQIENGRAELREFSGKRFKGVVPITERVETRISA